MDHTTAARLHAPPHVEQSPPSRKGAASVAVGPGEGVQTRDLDGNSGGGDGGSYDARYCCRVCVLHGACTSPPSRAFLIGEVGVVAENELVARIECSLGPGVLGGEMALANDDRGLRVLVDRASKKARASGVAVGDVLLSFHPW